MWVQPPAKKKHSILFLIKTNYFISFYLPRVYLRYNIDNTFEIYVNEKATIPKGIWAAPHGLIRTEESNAVIYTQEEDRPLEWLRKAKCLR